MPPPAEASALARVPDVPLWVDTRGMLLTGRGSVHFGPDADHDRDGFVVVLPSRALMSVVGAPPPDLITATARSMEGSVNVLATADGAVDVGAALHGWRQHQVLIYALPGVMPWEETPESCAGVFHLADAPSLDRVPEALRAELMQALGGHPTARFVPGALPPTDPADRARDRVPVAAAWVDDEPVAFCYPVLETETLWDVSVDTIERYRGHGLAGRAARALIRHMRGKGKAPVWGALAGNVASQRVAARLGFVLAGQLAVFTSS